MNKYVLTLAAALLIAAAPAYYAFQAQAEESAPAASVTDLKEGDVISCDTLPEDADTPDECIDAALEKSHGHDDHGHEGHGDHDDHAAPEKSAE